MSQQNWGACFSASCRLSGSSAAWSIQRVTCRGRCSSNYTVVLRLSGCNKEEIIKGGVLMDGGCISSIWQSRQLPRRLRVASSLSLRLNKYCPNPSCNGKCKLQQHVNNGLTMIFCAAISNCILISHCRWTAQALFIWQSSCFSKTLKNRVSGLWTRGKYNPFIDWLLFPLVYSGVWNDLFCWWVVSLFFCANKSIQFPCEWYY